MTDRSATASAPAPAKDPATAPYSPDYWDIVLSQLRKRPAAMVSGILLVLLYAALRCWAARFIGGAARVHRRKAAKPRELVTDGPFAYVRNPLYVANSLGIAGACALAAPPSAPISSSSAMMGWRQVIAPFITQ